MNFREDDLRAGGADVDADAGQRHVVLDPQRVFLERAVVVEFVVVVVGFALVFMGPSLAHGVLRHGMRGLRLFFLGHVGAVLPDVSWSFVRP